MATVKEKKNNFDGYEIWGSTPLLCQWRSAAITGQPNTQQMAQKEEVVLTCAVNVNVSAIIVGIADSKNT